MSEIIYLFLLFYTGFKIQLMQIEIIFAMQFSRIFQKLVGWLPSDKTSTRPLRAPLSDAL